MVKQLPTEFLFNPKMPGHRFHKLNTKENRFFSISVNMDLRVIVLRDKGRILFCYVSHHDDAYDWARRRRVEVHPVTGAAQLVELEEVIREQVTYVQREAVKCPIFISEEDNYLLSLGVPEAWLERIKQIDADGLLEILDRLPEEAAEALFRLANGERPEQGTQQKITKDTDPFTHPDAQRRFWVTSDEQALKQALNYPWDQWTIFLHPSQRDAVERNFGGPVRISGSAGTGKTVVALHRAVFLARKFESARVLLTTYSRPLVASLEEGLDKLAGVTGNLRQRIRVEHLHKLAHEIASSTKDFSFAPVHPKELDRFFDAAISKYPGVGVTRDFLHTEFDAVIDYWGVKSLSEYQKIGRYGRENALSLERRTAIWPIFAYIFEQMRDAKRMTWSDLAEAGQRVAKAHNSTPFNYVVADEAQDFGPRELRFLMSLAPVGTYSHFFTGDSSQRIYRYPFAWSRAGVDMRGRGTTLVVNYRTTSQIKNFASAALEKVGPRSEEEFSSGEVVSLMSGPEPIIEQCTSPEDEAKKLAEWLCFLGEQAVEPGEIAIFARSYHLLEERAIPALEEIGLPGNAINSNQREKPGSISVGTLHSAKGLEFRAVAIIGCDAEFLPHSSVLNIADDGDGNTIAETRERQLFYVGCTRPREILRISFCGRPTMFLSDLK